MTVCGLVVAGAWAVIGPWLAYRWGYRQGVDATYDALNEQLLQAQRDMRDAWIGNVVESPPADSVPLPPLSRPTSEVPEDVRAEIEWLESQKEKPRD